MEEKINAGEFSGWISDFIRTMRGMGEGNVPCGGCVECCTSSKFIHIRPTDMLAIKHIPKEIMFQAPGLPARHYLLGYDEKGHCPMFNEGQCSIYEFRPETCRQYDCRVLAVSGLDVSEEGDEIAKKVSSWKFEYNTSESMELSEAVKLAGYFLSEYSSCFPKGMIPLTGAQLSVLAVRVHLEFVGQSVSSIEENYESLIEAIISKYLG